MINKVNILSKSEVQRRIILLCFAAFFAIKFSFAQVRFIKTMYGAKNHSEFPLKPVELKDCYLIPIVAWDAFGTSADKFYILKLDKKGNIVSRTYFDNWDFDRGALFNANNNNVWKISASVDSTDYSLYFTFHLLDSNLKELLKVKIPKTYPKEGMLGLELFNYLKLANGDFIFMLDVSIFGWYPFLGRETYGNNFIYITKEGEIKANRTFNAFRIYNGNYIWQLNDTSIIVNVSLNNCNKNCTVEKVFDFKGNEISSTTLIKKTPGKKFGKQYYSFGIVPSGYSFICMNENFEVLYEKVMPANITPMQFWDNRDNNDLRIRVKCDIVDSNGNLTYDSYEAMMDTSFAWQKLRLFSSDANDAFSDLYGITAFTESGFYPTTDGGALFLFNKTLIANYDYDLVIVKVDTNYNWFSNMYSEKDKNVIYPNPNFGNRLFLEKDNWETISVYDFSGIKVRQYENPVPDLTDSIDIKNLTRGNYYLQIKFPDKTIYNKFIRY